jgi:hypothetical protein
MRWIFWGFCRNWFLIDPLNYLSSRSDFGFEFAALSLAYPGRRYLLLAHGDYCLPSRRLEGVSTLWAMHNARAPIEYNSWSVRDRFTYCPLTTRLTYARVWETDKYLSCHLIAFRLCKNLSILPVIIGLQWYLLFYSILYLYTAHLVIKKKKEKTSTTESKHD